MKVHPQFLWAYRSGRWDEAEAAIRECRDLGIAGLEHYYKVFLGRIAGHRASPPPEDWGGVFTSQEK